MIVRWHTNRRLWRLPAALIVVLSLALAASGPVTHAEEGWPHLPSDAEIAQARDRLVAESTFTNPPCETKCEGDPDDYDTKLCLAKACLNEFRMGQEIRESAITEVEIVKAHDPTVVDPAAAAYVFFPYTLKQTVEYSDHSTVEVIEYRLARLDYGRESYDASTYQQWYPTGRGFEIDVVQDDPTSRAQRDAVLNSYFTSGWLVRGFPGEASPVSGVTPTPDPRFPCPWPAFFYPGMSFDGYFNDQPSLRYSREWMVANLAQGLQSYIDEGNEPSLGIRVSDVYNVGASYTAKDMPTGNEAALQARAREMARDKQRSGPSYRLTPGDLFYLSLKLNHGNVRDALLTCHSALYRDGPQVNKAFIEKDNVLQPLRNPAGYVDGEWSFKNVMGSTQTINPRKAIGNDEQGVWYHFFGMAALEFTDEYGAASYYAAWAVVSNGGLHGNYYDEVVKRGHPTSQMGGDLADLAVALEDSARKNTGSAPDVAKYCINYYAIAAGRELKRVMWSYFGQQPNPVKERFANLGSGGDILNPNTIVTKRSPLSLRIQGTNGEWFAFDESTASLDGNTASVYFEAFPEEDGSWGVVAVPFFEVASMEMDATGDGPVTLGLYDPATTGSAVYEFTVQTGDAVRVPDGGLTAELNDEPLVPTYETAGNTVPEPASGSVWPESSSRSTPGLLLAGVCGGLLVVSLVGGLAVWRLSRRKPASQRPRREPVGQPIAASPASKAPEPAAPQPRWEPVSQPAATTPRPTAGDQEAEGAHSGWQLVLASGAENGRCFMLGAEAHLGRSTDNDVCIDDDQASRQHALIRCHDDGCELYDLDSRNGTWVNGLRISQPTHLQPGDRIQLGNTSLRVVRAGA